MFNRKLSLFLITICLFCSCKKEEDTSNAALILGRWTYSSSFNETYTNGTLTNTTVITYGPTDYLEFKENAVLIVNTAPYPLTQDGYRIEGDSIVFANPRKAKINVLTAHDLVFVFTTYPNATQKAISIHTLKR